VCLRFTNKYCYLVFYYYQLAKLLKSVEHKAQREILHKEELIFEFSNSNLLQMMFFYLSNGGVKRDRTADLLRARQALSQLSYNPIQYGTFVVRLGAVNRSILSYVRVAATTPGGELVGLSRLELPTSPLSGVRSNHLSYRPAVTAMVLTVCSTLQSIICVNTYHFIHFR
jgi:hypothetical protein